MEVFMALGFIGIIVAMLLFVFLVYRGWSVFYVAPLCVLLIAVTSGLNPIEALANTFVGGITDTVKQLFWVIFLGAILGKLYGDTGAAASVTNTLMKKFVLPYEGEKRLRRAMLVIVVVTLILTYGGIDAFILCFLMFPLNRSIAKQLNIPRRLIPAMLCTSAIVMGSPGAPQFNNILATQILHLPPTAGLIPGLIAMIIGEIGIYFVLSRTVLKAAARGETYDDGPLPPMEEEAERKLPNFWLCLIPPALVIVLYTFLQLHIIIALAASIVSALIFLGSHISRDALFPGKKLNLYNSFIRTLNVGADTYPNPIIAVTTPAGVAMVVTSTAVFGALIGMLSGLAIHPLLLTFVFIVVFVALTSSPPATLMVVLPVLAGMFLTGEGGPMVAPGALARIAALTTTTWETLPFNGLITLTCTIMAKTSLKESYGPIFWQTVIWPTIGSIIALALFILFPGLG
jgi:H+/gluconate symporter-like permease